MHRVRFIDQIVVRHPFSGRGDSGSIVFTPEGRFIGLLWAGGGIGTIVCKSRNIVNWVEETIGEMRLRPGAFGAEPPDLPPGEDEMLWLPPVVGGFLVGGGLMSGIRHKNNLEGGRRS